MPNLYRATRAWCPPPLFRPIVTEVLDYFHLQVFTSYIVQWIRSSVNAFGYQTLNTKRHVCVTLGRKALTIQNKFHNTRAHCCCEKTILAYVKTVQIVEINVSVYKLVQFGLTDIPYHDYRWP